MVEEHKLNQMGRKTAVFSKILKNFERVNALIYAVGALMIFLLIMITLLDVGGRNLFRHPLPGANEISELAMVMIIFMCFGYSFTLKSHISVEILISRFPARARTLVERMTKILTLIFLMVMVLQSTKMAFVQAGNYTMVLEIPTFFFSLLVPIGSAMAIISLLGNLVVDVLSISQDKGGAI